MSSIILSMLLEAKAGLHMREMISGEIDAFDNFFSTLGLQCWKQNQFLEMTLRQKIIIITVSLRGGKNAIPNASGSLEIFEMYRWQSNSLCLLARYLCYLSL